MSNIYDSNFIKFAKIATAIAVIKTKPTCQTGEDYARELCTKFREDQLELERRNEELSLEILRLRRNLVTSRLLQEDRDVSPRESKMILTPPCSSEFHPEPKNGLDSLLKEHCQFYQSILCIQGACDQVESAVGFSLTETTLVTCCFSLKRIRQYLLNQLGASSNLTNIANVLATVVRLVQKLPTLQKERLCQEVMILVEEVGNCIVKNKDTNMRNTLNDLTRLLVTLSEVPTLRGKILCYLVQQIRDFSHVLRIPDSDEVDNFAWSFENIFYIFQTCEHILTDEINLTDGKSHGIRNSKSVEILTNISEGEEMAKSVKDREDHSDDSIRRLGSNVRDSQASRIHIAATSCSAGEKKTLPSIDESRGRFTNGMELERNQGIDDNEKQLVNEMLESSQLHLSKRFPLFTHYVWRLSALLNCLC